MRTTIRLPDDLLRDLKRLASESDQTLTSVIEDALRAALDRCEAKRDVEPVRLTTFGRGWTLPGVNLDHTASLHDRMESGTRPS
ncbi:MAG TPA: ribbon-helix-helix protein, CopG family [Gemmatimonadota bacterium]|nr:ribbon-helix-helix protein, CopG family [Gemmatimonadota bacterium]